MAWKLGGLVSVNTILENGGHPDRYPGQLVAEVMAGQSVQAIMKHGCVELVAWVG